jgi:hypothetical protein
MLLACEVPENGFLPRPVRLDPEIRFAKRVEPNLREIRYGFISVFSPSRDAYAAAVR